MKIQKSNINYMASETLGKNIEDFDTFLEYIFDKEFYLNRMERMNDEDLESWKNLFRSLYIYVGKATRKNFQGNFLEAWELSWYYFDAGKRGIIDVIDIAGSERQLAKQLGVSRWAVAKWRSTGKVPLVHALEIERIYGRSAANFLDYSLAENLEYVQMMGEVGSSRCIGVHRGGKLANWMHEIVERIAVLRSWWPLRGSMWFGKK